MAADDDVLDREHLDRILDGRAVPPGIVMWGTMFPTFRTMKSSPGPALVSKVGTTRESEQVMNNVSGFCPTSASC